MPPMALILFLAALALVPGCTKEERKIDEAAAGGEGGVAIYFSPATNCREKIIENIKLAESEILVQAYSFNSEKIAKALVERHKLGVKVTVILDSEKADKKSETNFLAKRGIDTYIDDKHKAHNKILIIDGRTVITGSFNFNDADEDTADNLVIMRDKPKIAEAYKVNFESHLKHSEKHTK